jgi:Domain of unknown function (DUF4434)
MNLTSRTVILVPLLSIGSGCLPGFSGTAAALNGKRNTSVGVHRAGGGFISLDNSSALHPPEDHQETEWCEILHAMRRVGLDTVILTRLEYRDEEGEEWSFLRDSAFDAAERILTCADALGMQVLIGLWEDVGFDDECLREEYLEQAARKSLTLAEEVWRRYHGTHPSFSGWYIPLEPWNIGAGTHRELRRKTRLLNRFYRTVTRGVDRFGPEREAERMRVAVSAYFNPDDEPEWLSPAPSIPMIFADILRDSGVDIMMLQDGAGLRYPKPGVSDRVKQQFRRHVREYFTSFAEACHITSPPVQLWGLLEVFEFDSSAGTYRPATFDRLEDQMETVSSAVPGIRFALFDFYHHMNPVIHDAGSGRDTQNAAMLNGRQELYQRYKTAFPKEWEGR